ncbi:MAG TPA: archease [Gemmatimonadota bacterium]|jgi:SHS2 domain-containing protein
MEPLPASARFEEHVGELRLALRAPTLEGLFVEAAGVVARECGRTEGEPGPWEPLRLAARDPATLLVDWLNELIGRSEVEGRAYREVRGLRLSGAVGRGDTVGAPTAVAGASRRATRSERAAPDALPGAANAVTVDAEVRGSPVSVWESALKAATYHGLELTRDGDGWRAAVLFDV